MSKYNKQVDKISYQTEEYETIPRFSSYYHQQRLLGKIIKNIQKKKRGVSILEIGSGSAFLKNYIKTNYPDVTYKVMDIADDLEPDYIGDMTQIDSIVKEKFDIICAFQVLEHVEYKDAITTIAKISNLTDNLVISLPYVRLYLSMRFKASVLRPLNILFSLPFPKKHEFDGQHYWELGTRGYSLKKFRKDIAVSLKIVAEFSDGLNPWHRFFVLRK